MAQRLLNGSSNPKIAKRAVLLKVLIKKTQELGTPNKFSTLIDLLKTNKAISLNDAKEAMDRSKMVAEDIRALLAILMSDNRDAQLKAEKDHIQRMIKLLGKAIQVQKVARAQNESGQADPKELGKAQDKAKEAAQDVAKAMDPKGGEPKDGKSKDGQPKDGKFKDGQPKDGSPKDGQPKDGQPKDGKGSENKDDQKPPGDPAAGRACLASNSSKKLKINRTRQARTSKKKTRRSFPKLVTRPSRRAEEVRKRWEELLKQARRGNGKAASRVTGALRAHAGHSDRSLRKHGARRKDHRPELRTRSRPGAKNNARFNCPTARASSPGKPTARCNCWKRKDRQSLLSRRSCKCATIRNTWCAGWARSMWLR